jgi:hypothetical protein
MIYNNLVWILFSTSPKLPTLIRRSPMSRTSQKLALQPVQNGPGPPPSRLSPSASSRWLPALSSQFALQPSHSAGHPYFRRWFNLISPRSIRPFRVRWTGTTWASPISCFLVFDLIRPLVFSPRSALKCTTGRPSTTGSRNSTVVGA